MQTWTKNRTFASSRSTPQPTQPKRDFALQKRGLLNRSCVGQAWHTSCNLSGFTPGTPFNVLIIPTCASTDCSTKNSGSSIFHRHCMQMNFAINDTNQNIRATNCVQAETQAPATLTHARPPTGLRTGRMGSTCLVTGLV